ncbi:MAG: tetratricopeptide repeat protein, partial [Rhodothermaceae bacterium]|nr:tetratricopeptide repeat protein [Rhodothermaceae bacterium]
RWTGMALKNLAEFHLETGDIAVAERLFQRMRAISDETLDPGHSFHAVPLLGLGRVALAQGRAVEAEPLLREALAIQEEHLGPDHQRTAEVQTWLGASLTAQGRPDEAQPLIEASARFGEGEARRSIQRAIRANQAAFRAAQRR